MNGETQGSLFELPAARRPHPLVVHCKRAKFEVYVGRGRGSPWGNPFQIGRDGTRLEVIAKYREWLGRQPALLARLPELRGKVLGCWCSPRPCHAEVLAELANAPGAAPTAGSGSAVSFPNAGSTL
jgi:hypothetical protein